MRLQYWLDEVVLKDILVQMMTQNKMEHIDLTIKMGYPGKSGQKLLDYINSIQDFESQDPLKILDVGCGENEWKPKFGGRLIGIDPST